MARIFISIFLFLSINVFSQQPDSCRQKITLSFIGDMMCHMPQQGAARNPDSTYDFYPCFQFLKPYFLQTDIAVVNLETTFSGKPYSGYPQFSAPNDIALAAKDAGLNYFIMANNHCYDKGRKGFERTLNVLDSLGIVHTGVFRNKAERDTVYPLIIRKNNFTIAILNFTYSTNGIPIEKPTVVNNLDTTQIAADIDSCKKYLPDIIIACPHWGMEYERKQNKQQEALARWLLNKGCNAVIGSHPHVVQPVKIYYPDKTDSANIKVVYFSIGNFLSNQRDRYRDGGIIAELSFEKDSAARLVSFNYLPFWVYKGVLDGKYQYYAIPAKQFVQDSTAIKIPGSEKTRLLEFYNDTKLLLGKTSENDFYKKNK